MNRWILVMFLLPLYPFVQAETELLAIDMPCQTEKLNETDEPNNLACPMHKASVIKLIARSEVYEGKRVMVHGFVHFEPEGRSLYISRRDAEDDLTENALWLGEFRANAQIEDCQDRYATVVGTFRGESYGHMREWSGAIEEITMCIGHPPMPSANGRGEIRVDLDKMK